VNDIKCSLTLESLNNFALHWMGPRIGPCCAPALILWLGELKSSTTANTVDLDSSGQIRCSPMCSSGAPTLHFRFYWGTKQICWDLDARGNDNSKGTANGTKVRYKPLISMNCG